MIDATRTTTRLLNDLQSGDNAAWAELDRRYRPILFNFARRLGVSDADAADVAQETLATFATLHKGGKYDRSRGRVRSLLVGIAKNKVLEAKRSRRGRGGEDQPDVSDEGAEESEADRIWEAERKRRLLAEAMQEFRRTTRTKPQALEVFDLLVVRGLKAPDVAQSLGMSPQEVHLAKSRCLARFKEVLAKVEAAYEED